MKIVKKKLKQNFTALKQIFIFWSIFKCKYFGLSRLIQREMIL